MTEGPRGVAYLGKESDDLPLRVIKLLRPDPATGGDDSARFARVQSVSSSHVARTLAHGMHGDQPYVVREHVEGRSLAEIVAEDGPLDGDSLERLATGVLTALTAVHLAGITHRSLTPNNVIVASDGPRVTDVDLGEPAGEVGYRAPEQIRGLGYGPSADIFAWGAIVVFAATGKAPFGQAPEAVLDGEPEVGDLPDRLRRVVLLALSKDVGKRPTTYTALLQLLGDKRGEAAAIATQKVPSMPGAPIEGVPVQGAPGQGVSPVAGPPQWGPQVPQEPVPGGPVPPGPMPQGGAPVPPGPPQIGPVPPVPGGPGPMQGVPMQPPAPVWGPPQDQPQPQVLQSVPGQTVSSRAPRKSFPMGLAAAVGALALLSGVGLWGANHYATTQRFEPVAAAVDAPPSEGGAAGVGGTGDSGGQPEQPAQGQPQVTVPWAATPSADPNDVGPMVLPTDWTSPTPPELSTVPTPLQIPNQPVTPPPAQPTAVPATVPATVTVTPTPTVTVTPTQTTPTPSPPPTQTPTPTETSTETGTPTPSETATPTPSETRTRHRHRHTPTPTVTVSPSPTATAKPPVTVTAKPPVTVTAKPTVTVTVKPTARPKPTPSFGLTPSAKPTNGTPPTEMRNPKNPVAVCGPGFTVQRQQAFRGGETFLLYNGSTGENCVVTMKTVDVGKSTPVSATLEVQGGESRTDSASYEFYAGPVKLPAKGKCVRFRGSVGSGSTSSNWSNCG
ncbi:serine/threonine protein kinase [Nonomuraea jiangxiensis]|uniref:serine/threonine protein kinase n=1 Tax=Nonomuraea jiangxiensis TaxID=633440 RepID=UPI0015A18617|nr:serine/threonine-protein kinase [Nonomuraea jiangxiensis]